VMVFVAATSSSRALAAALAVASLSSCCNRKSWVHVHCCSEEPC
jgi:hypothetical protein